MSQSEKRIKAAKLVAEDRLTDEAIAAACGIERRTLARWKLDETFAVEVKALHVKAAEGAAKATEQKAFNTTERLIELATLAPKDTNGTIHGQVKACMGVAAIRGEIVERHADVTDRLRNKTADELDFIALHRRDPADGEELKAFIESRAVGQKLQ